MRPDAVILCLGGASWPRLGATGTWTQALIARGIEVTPWRPANCGFTVDWSEIFRPRFAGAYFTVSGVAILLAFPCTLAMLKLPFPYAWIAVFGAVFFLFFNTGPANTALANVTSPAMRATAFAINIFLIHAFGDALSPPLIGWVKSHTNWDTAFTLVSLMMVLASALWFIAARYLGADTAAVEQIESARDAEEAKAV